MALQPVSTTVTTNTAERPRLGLWVGSVCLLLGLYLLVVCVASLVGIYDVRTNSLGLAKSLGFTPPTDAEALADARIALLTMFGASMGACLLSFLGLFRHAVIAGNFTLRFLGSYLVGPIAVMFLGFAVFVLMRAGLFVLGNVGDSTKITSNNELSFLALGILVGFSWNHVLARFAEIGSQIFASSQESVPTSVPPAGTTTATATATVATPATTPAPTATVTPPTVTPPTVTPPTGPTLLPGPNPPPGQTP